MSSCLYLTRNGLLEPLGQSQVMSYLRGLSVDYTITLVTLEKPEDLANEQELAEAQADCNIHRIHWKQRRFRRWPRLLAPTWSMIELLLLAWRAARNGEAKLMHARSYLPAAAAWGAWRLTGRPFIFDMRALWPEEMITAGRLRRGSLVHRAITSMERVCLRDAAAVVSLTEAAVAHLKREYPRELDHQRMVVIPTCADLERFVPATKRSSGPSMHGCIGTVLSGWFRLDWLAAWIKVAAERDPAASFDIVTRDDASQVRASLDPESGLGNRLRISARSPNDMPDAIREHELSVMFYAGDEVSELGRSPTRMGEVLGCGLPVVANAGVGDVAQIITKYGVGVLVEGSAPEQMSKALDELEELLADPDLGSRCRAAAEAVFSLEAGTEAYRRLYAEILQAEQI